MDFVHLHLHSEYSLLDGAIRIEEVIDQAKKMGMSSLAITDHGVMYGAINFYQKAKAAGIKPIVGCEVYLAPGSRFEKVAVKGNSESAYHLVLLAKNQEGYRNLVQLVSKGFLEGFYYKPRVDKSILREYSSGLFALSACLAGEIPRLILDGKREEAEKVALEYQDIFGAGNFYLEVQENKIPEQKVVNQALVEISQKYKIPLVATNDCHYLRADDASVHDVILAIQTATTLDDPKRLKFSTPEFYFKSPAEMERDFASLPEALENTVAIAENCNLEINFDQFHLPVFQVPAGFTLSEYLHHLCLEGLRERYGDPPPARAREQLEYELDVIERMGFEGYFLIVWDFIEYARRQGIMVGPGRGSAAGSIVAYSLGITSIDPLKYGLLFERFLNPERVSMPDIDVDFCFERRDEVIAYVAEKYGKTNVAQIITFGRMMARQAVRDVGRALGWSYGEVDKIAKLIPGGPGVTLEKTLATDGPLRKAMKDNQAVAQLLGIAQRIEGLCRHASVHAAGVVISDQPLTNYVPLQKMNEGEIVTQYDMDSLQDLGLLKMDFLGLRTLTIIERALNIIKKTRREEVQIDKIPLDDPDTYRLLAQGETTGVFQLESSGMKDLLKRLKSEQIEDLIALLALYRPGPLGSGMIDDFIRRKHGEIKVTFPHPDLEPILRETYGVILYQEQVMKIASQLAGFTLGQADILRRAMGKKKPEVMREQRKQFIAGAVARGYDQKTAEEIFDLIEYFAGYGFNKSHSAAYAFISYQTAYLKAHYPTEFLTACLTSVANDSEKVAKFIGECKRLGITVLPPDINESLDNFTVVGDRRIRFGLAAIKNVGHNAVAEILSRRQESFYKDLFDFLERVNSRVINKRVVESLIKAGAFDSLHANRLQLLASLEDILSSLARRKKKKSRKQMSLFGEEIEDNNLPINFKEAGELTTKELLNMEKEMLGLYISDHPVKNILRDYPHLQVVPLEEIHFIREPVPVRIMGALASVRKIRTKNGKEMFFATLEDETGSVEVIFFPNLAEEFEKRVASGEVLCVTGKVDVMDSGVNKVIAEEISSPDQLATSLPIIHIKLPLHGHTLEIIRSLKNYLANRRGTRPVVLHLIEEEKEWAVELGNSFWVKEDPQLENEIHKFIEEEKGEVWIAS